MPHPENVQGQEALFDRTPPQDGGDEDFPIVDPGPSRTAESETDDHALARDKLDELYARTYRHVYQLLKEIWGERVTPHEVHEATATLFIAKADAR